MKILLLIYLAFMLPSLAYAKQAVTFLSYEYFLTEEEKSIADERYLAAFTQALSHKFKVEQYTTNAARMLKQLSTQTNVCSFNILKTTQREKQFIFSAMPSSMFLQRRVFGLKETLKDLPEQVSISKLLANKYTFATLTSTSYQELDSMLAMYQHQIMPIIGAGDFSRLAKLLLHKRVDMIIDYDMSVKHFLTPQQYAELDSREIIEYPEFNSGYFACSRTQVGAEVIEQIDALMQSAKMHQPIKQYHYASFQPEIAARIMTIYKTYYKPETYND